MCDRPVADVLIFDRDGLGDRRMPYCYEHAKLMKAAFTKRKIVYRTEIPAGGDKCSAWMDL